MDYKDTNRSLTAAQEMLINALNWRYATKKFDTERKIDEANVDLLLEALRLAPSSMGLQPYKFIRVVDAKMRTALKDVSMGQAQITDAAELIVFAAKQDYNNGDIDNFLQVSKERRGYSDEALNKRRDSIAKYIAKFENAELLQWNARQLYVALGQLLTAAAVLGIDACPMEGIKADEYDKLLNLEILGLRAFAVVTLGYRSPDDALATDAKVRLPMEQLLITV